MNSRAGMVVMLFGILLTLEGTLDSITSDAYVIRKGSVLYYVAKSAVHAEKKREMKELQKEVILQVTPEAITLVRDMSEKNPD